MLFNFITDVFNNYFVSVPNISKISFLVSRKIKLLVCKYNYEIVRVDHPQ